MSPPPVDSPSRQAPGEVEQALAAERELLKNLFPLPPRRPPRSGAGKTVRRVGSAVVVAVVAAALWWADPVYREERYATAPGERQNVALADGSTLLLDADTRLAVRWRLRTREAVLAGGRVRFTVAPAIVRPFEVAAGASRARVVGTVFDVRRDGQRVAVAVLEGRVRVTAGDRPEAAVLLGRGERVAADGEHLAAPAAADPGQAAWSEGRLVFERTPLREALADLQRQLGRPLRLHGEAIAGLEISGTFDVAQGESLLDLLPAILPVRVVRRADGSVDVSPQ